VVQAVGSKDRDKVMATMQATPINDFITHDGELRIDGRCCANFICSR